VNSLAIEGSILMRRIIQGLAIAATVAALATPALARQDGPYSPNYTAPVVTGAVVGTAVGVGLYNGWWGSSAAVAAFPATAAGAAATGGIAGVGTVVLIDAALQPCRGFHALFGMNHGQCVDGNYDGPR
jgi:hypothetical protein